MSMGSRSYYEQKKLIQGHLLRVMTDPDLDLAPHEDLYKDLICCREWCGIVGPVFGWQHTIIFLHSEQHADRCVSVDSSVVKKFLFPLPPSLSLPFLSPNLLRLQWCKE